jgi:hypothetical protein
VKDRGDVVIPLSTSWDRELSNPENRDVDANNMGFSARPFSGRQLHNAVKRTVHQMVKGRSAIAALSDCQGY